MGKNKSNTSSATNSTTDDITNATMNQSTNSITNSNTNSNTSSNTASNSVNNANGMSTTTPTYTNTSMSNPYYRTTTDEFGNVVSTFAPGTAGDTAYNYVNQNIAGLLDNYLNPSLDSTTNQAKMYAFNQQQQSNLQNNIINPLATNNMLRSSQATNMYNNLSNQSADYAQNLLANSQQDTWDMINNLVNLYAMGYTGTSSDIARALQSAVGSTSTNSSTSTQNSNSNTNSNTSSSTQSNTQSNTSADTHSETNSKTKSNSNGSSRA